MNLKTKFVGIALLFLSILLGVSLFALHAVLERDLLETARVSQHGVADRLASDIEARFAFYRQAQQAVAERFPVRDLGSPEKLEAFLRAHPVLSILFRDLVILDPEGNAVADWPQVPGRRGANYRDRDYLRVAVDERRPYVSDPLLGRALNAPVVVMTVPVIRDEKVVAVLSGLVDLMKPAFLGAIAARKLGAQGYVAVISRDGRYIVHPDKARLLKAADEPGVAGALARLRAAGGGVRHDRYDDGMRGAVFATLRSLDSLGWTLIAAEPEEQLLAPARETFARTLRIVLALLVFALPIFWLVTARLMRPLEQLSAQIARAEGTPDQIRERIGLRSGDEIGDAANAFRALLGRVAERESELRLIMDNVPAMIARFDAEERLVYANRKYLEFYGIGLDESKGRHLKDLIGAENFAAARAHYAPVLSGTTITYTGRRIAADGSVRYVDACAAPDPGQAGAYGFFLLAMDITARRAAEGALREERDFVSAVLDNAGALVVVLDHEGRIVRFNRAAELLSGWRAEEIAGKHPWATFLPPESAERIRVEAFEALVRKPQALSGEYTNEWLSRDGRRHLLNWTNTLLLDGEGRVRYMVSIGTDITEQTRVAKALRASEARLKTLFEHSPVSMWEEDFAAVRDRMAELRAQGVRDWGAFLDANPDELKRLSRLIKVVDANQTSVELFGARDKGEVLAAPERYFSDDVFPVMREIIVALAEGRDRYSGGEISARLPTGIEKWVRVDLVVVTDHAESLSRVLISFMDVTVRRRAVQALRESEMRLSAFFRSSPTAHSIVRYPDGEHLEVSDAWLQLFRLRRDEVRGRTARQINHWADSSDREAWLAESLRAGGVRNRLVRLRRGDGTHFLARVWTDSIEFGGERLLLTSLVDVTEQEARREAVERSEARLKEAQRLAKMGSWDLDLVGGRLDWSDEIFRIFEVDKARFGATYEAFLNAVHPDDRDAVNRAYSDSVTNRTPYEYEHRLLFGDGRIKWVRERGQTFYDESGEPLRSHGTVQDVTAERVAAMRERESNERFGRFFEMSPDSITLVTLADGKFVHMNEGFERFTGWTRAEALGRDAKDLGLWDDPAQREYLFRELRAGRTVRDLEARIRRKDGTYRYGVRFSTVVDFGGVPHVLSIMHDITERKRTEELLRRKEQHIRDLFDTLPMAVGHADLDERITFTNRPYREIYAGGADPVGRTIRDVVGEAIYAAISGHIRRVLAGEEVVLERQFALAGGDVGTRWLHYVPERDARGEVTGFFAVIQDISERKRVEAELERQAAELRDANAALSEAKLRAEAANAAKTEFLANMSHELRTPVHGILSFARLGLERAPGAEAGVLARYFDRIARSGERLLALVNGLLDLSKLEAGKVVYRFGELELGAVLAEVQEETVQLARDKGLELLREGLEQLGAWGDGERVVQVVSNLVANAIRFTPAGGRVVLRLAEAGERARIEVEDTGVGIPEGELERIFEKFAQSTRTESRAGGTGLGLAICAEIVAAHGGEIRAANRAGGGALFTVELPKSDWRPAPARAAASRTSVA